ncbi:MAG: NUDIX domain-containing protein [Treponema sp.]|nr:NUDIX domain-containing protein [Treponema sp.]
MQQQPGRSVAGIAIDDGRFFVARRKPGGNLGDKWEFPGGKVEDGESDGVALEREYLEEFGVAVKAGPLLASAEFSNKGRRFLLNAYRVFFGSLDFCMAEHVEWRWATPDEIESGSPFAGNFADSDLGLLPALRAYLSAVPTGPAL